MYNIILERENIELVNFFFYKFINIYRMYDNNDDLFKIILSY